MTKPGLYSRCRCHSQLIFVQYDGDGYEESNKTRFCIVTRKPLKQEQTYLAAFDTSEEVKQAEPKVQRGAYVD